MQLKTMVSVSFLGEMDHMIGVRYTMILIRNGNVHDGRGNKKVCDILVDGTKIKEVGTGLSHPQAVIIEAAGLEVFPGFINTLNVWGVLGPEWNGDDKSEESNPVTPEMNIAYAFDHDGMNFQKVYTYGVTAAGIAPSPRNVISGQAAVYKTYGRSPYAMLVRERAAMIASVTRGVKKAYEKRDIAPMTRMGIFSLLAEQLEKAKRYDRERDGYDAKNEAMQEVLGGRQPLFVNCATKAEIDAVFSVLKPYPNIRFVLTGAYGLDESKAELLQGTVMAVMGDHTENFIESSTLTQFDKIIPMMESGAKIAIGCCGDGMTSGRESLLWNAILWRKQGLSSEKTIEAITSIPAEILGVSDRIGAIAPGMDADITIWSANPIETYEARILHAFISGEDILKKEAYQSCW